MHWMERLKYWFYKRYVKKVVAKDISPFVALPFLMFIDFDLDKIFQESGMAGAKEAVRQWPEKFQTELDEKIRRLEKDIEKNLEFFNKVRQPDEQTVGEEIAN